MVIINDNNMQVFFSDWYNNAYRKLNGVDISDINKNTFLPRNIQLDYDTMQKNLHMIFGENANIEKQICLFDDVLEFLRYVVGIDGVDRLFSKHFYDIEWNMFLEADFEKSEMKIYRDHFVHQIRNAYLGYYVIWEMGLYKNIECAINEYSSTSFSQFIEVYKAKEIKDEDRKNFVKKVIMKTWFLAAFFHDIGYPLAYHQRYSAKMDKYMPYLRVFDNRRQMDFVELSALLADTYLFKMVDYKELKDKYENFDHGMLSAICLLLNYYHTGAIHRLCNQDRCSIELAAYAIFVHTRKYSIQENNKKNKGKHIRPVFIEDPISYILRLCDDLQEWSRVYFLIGENSNNLICDKCKKILQKDGDKYYCSCGIKFHKGTEINYRKINLVQVCEELEIHDDGQQIIFKLNYDLIRLLEVLNIDKKYASYREKELSNLIKLLDDQALLPKMDIKYFISNNHMEIKIEIIRRYIERYMSMTNINRMDAEYMISNKDIIESSILCNLKLQSDSGTRACLSSEISDIIKYLEKNQKQQLICKSHTPINYMDNIFIYKEIESLNKRIN